MTDPRLRALEREYLATRDPSAGAQLLVAKRRAGLVRSDQIRWAAAFGSEAAARALRLLRLRRISTAARAADRILSPVYEREGWSLFDSNYGLEIERIDDPQAWFMPTDPRSDGEIQRIIDGWQHWGSDIEVMRWVVKKALEEGSPAHLLALLLLRQESPNEYGDTAHVYYGGEYLGATRFGGTPHEFEGLCLITKNAATRLDMEIIARLIGPEFAQPVGGNPDEETRRLQREVESKPWWRVNQAEKEALRRARIRSGDLVCVACGRQLGRPQDEQDRREDARGLVCWRCFHGMAPNPGRGDEAIRQAQRGEGGDPKIEAWRRGIAVPPDRVWSNAPEWRAYWNLPGGGFVEVMLADILSRRLRDLPAGTVVHPGTLASRAHQLYGWVCDERGSHLVTPGTFVVWQADPGLKGPDWSDPAIQSAVHAAYSKPRSNPPGPTCPECSGPSLLLGELGGAQCYRCRQCGWHWQLRHGAPAPRAVLPADMCGWCAPQPCQCPKPKTRKKRKKGMNPGRGDEALRRAERGEGGDPKIEAWRRGLPVPPDRIEPLTPGSDFTMVGVWERPDASTGAALWTWPELGQRRIYSVPEEFVAPASYPSRVARPPGSAINWLDPDVQLLASEVYMGRRMWHPHQYRTPTSKWPHDNPPRGDEALRRSQRGEGGDPKLEAWRRGIAVQPDVVRPLRQDWPATVVAYWLTPGAPPIPEDRDPAAPAVWPQAVHAMSWLYSASGGVKRAYRVWMGPRPNESGDVNTFDYGAARWDEPHVQQFVQVAYLRALEEQQRGY